MGNRKFGFFDLLSFDLVFNLKSQRLTRELGISDATASSSALLLDFSVMKTCSYIAPPPVFPWMPQVCRICWCLCGSIYIWLYEVSLLQTCSPAPLFLFSPPLSEALSIINPTDYSAPLLLD